MPTPGTATTGSGYRTQMDSPFNLSTSPNVRIPLKVATHSGVKAAT